MKEWDSRILEVCTVEKRPKLPEDVMQGLTPGFISRVQYVHSLRSLEVMRG